MGIFDKVMGPKEEEKLTKEESFMAISLAAIAADGVITEEEARGLMISLYRMKTFAGVSDKQMSAMLNKIANIIKRQGIEALVTKAKETLPENMRATAFAVATDLVFADGDVDEKEKQIMTKIQQALGVSDAQAEKIIEVMMIKNKG